MGGSSQAPDNLMISKPPLSHHTASVWLNKCQWPTSTVSTPRTLRFCTSANRGRLTTNVSGCITSTIIMTRIWVFQCSGECRHSPVDPEISRSAMSMALKSWINRRWGNWCSPHIFSGHHTSKPFLRMWSCSWRRTLRWNGQKNRCFKHIF